jgi:hypothetical protein
MPDDMHQDPAAELLRVAEALRRQGAQAYEAAKKYAEDAPRGHADLLMTLAKQVRDALGDDVGMALLAGAMRMSGTGTLTVGGAIAGAVTLAGFGGLTAGGTKNAVGSVAVTGVTATAIAAAHPGEVTITPDVGELVSKAAREGIAGFSILQLLILILTCAIVFGLPFLEQVLPPGSSAVVASENDGIPFVCALIAAAIVANRKPRK